MAHEMNEILVLDGSNFERELTRDDLPLFVEFRADWCAPCRAMRTTLEAFAEQYAGRAKVAQVDVDAEPDLVEQYDISSIPTLILFSHGDAVQRIIGAIDVETLGASVEQIEAGA